MMNDSEVVQIYIFKEDDGQSVEERLKLAIINYCQNGGFPLNCDRIELKEKLQIARTDKGKPYFPKFPQIHFSISHSGAYWVCAVADEPLGVDLQEHVCLKGETLEEACVRLRKLAYRFFYLREAEFVERDVYNNFFVVWTAKESYVKYTGQGIDDDFAKQYVIPEEMRLWTQFSLKNRVVWRCRNNWFSSERYHDKYTLCVCTKKKREIIITEVC